MMASWMRRVSGDKPSEPIRLVQMVSDRDIIVVGISQSAPEVMITSSYGIFIFDQSATDTVVEELQKLAGFIDRSVAR